MLTLSSLDKLKCLFILLIFPLSVCAQTAEVHKDKIMVSYIEFDPSLDDSAFKICNDTLVYPYFYISISYKGGKRAIWNYIESNYKTLEGNTESGYITLRFIINCKGETGRFRMEQLSKDYQPYKFDDDISQQLLGLVKEMKEWQPAKHKEVVFDTIFYLTFKIENGKPVDLLP
jgi:hypothetical protein